MGSLVARFYDPELGRFLRMDPAEGDLTRPPSLNKYTYVLNNPTVFIDPTGRAEVLVTLGDFFADNKQILVRIGDALDDDQAGFLEQVIDGRLAVLIGRAAGTQGFAESTVRLLNLLVNVSLVDAKIRQGIDVGKPTDDALAEIGAIVVALEQAGAMIREDPTKAGVEIVRQGAEFVASKLLTAFKAATGDTGAISEVAAFETEGALDLVGLGGAAGGSKKGLSLFQRLLSRLGRLGDDLAGTAERRLVTLTEQAGGGALSREVVEELAERQALRGSPVDEALSEATRVPKGTTIVGGGARLENLSEPQRVAIQRFATENNVKVTVVGSRAARPGGKGLESDFDYIIEPFNSKIRKRAKLQLPRGLEGGEIGPRGPTGRDFLDTPVRTDEPFITFLPEE